MTRFSQLSHLSLEETLDWAENTHRLQMDWGEKKAFSLFHMEDEFISSDILCKFTIHGYDVYNFSLLLSAAVTNLSAFHRDLT